MPDNSMDVIPERLAEIIEDFQWCEGREKLELLLEYSERMPILPEWLEERHDEMQMVHECMTPVYVYAEMINGGMKFFFDIPPESPTVRGFASLLAEGLEGTTPEQLLRIPNDFYLKMQLQDVLTNQRLNGMTAIMAHIKRLAMEYM